MALKQIRLSKKIELKKSELRSHILSEAEIKKREKELRDEEKRIEDAYKEITADSPKEDMDTVEELAAELEGKKTELETLKNSFNEKKAELEGEIAELESELDALEKEQLPPDQGTEPKTNPNENREAGFTLNRRDRFFKDVPVQTRDRILAREDVKGFLTNVRTIIKEKRDVTGAELTVPDVLLELLRDNLHTYSKLIKYVNVRQVSGRARQTISGVVPEGVWTEACASLNELDISFKQVDIDGFKVGGYVLICNATLEDSDLSLASEIMDMLGKAIGRAVDKAILYGTGKKMPTGIATRLAQQSQPENWGENAPTWKDLHTSNIIKIDPTSKTAEAFFAELIKALSVCDNTYASAGTFWAMNRKTKMSLMAKAVNFSSGGALVAGLDAVMPIEGGAIVEIPDMADGDIMGGFGEDYILAERSGTTIAQSREVKFLDDQTAFKATARYDGMPVIGEAFVLVNIENKAPTTTATFTPDSANP